MAEKAAEEATTAVSPELVSFFPRFVGLLLSAL